MIDSSLIMKKINSCLTPAEERPPCDGVPDGHFVEQAGCGAWEPRVRVGSEEGSDRDRVGTGEGGGLEQDGVNGGGEGGVRGEEPEQGGHRRRPRSTRHFGSAE